MWTVAYVLALACGVAYLHARRSASAWDQRRATAAQHRSDSRWF